MNFSFGSDPEFFLKLNDHYKSAIEVVPGSIGQRHEIESCQFYWDNVLAECAIPPGYSRTEVVENFRKCFQLYSNLVKPYALEAKASAEMPLAEIKDPRAKVVGCHPDVCAYTTKSFKPNKKVMKTPFRSGGGHIHLGSTEGFIFEDSPERILLIYLLDLFLAVPSLVIDPDTSSPARRKLYGNAGRYRPTQYGNPDKPGFAMGIEYRPLGNFWLRSPVYVEFIYDVTQFVIDLIMKGNYKKLWTINQDKFYRINVRNLHKSFNCTYDTDLLQHCIRESDVEAAQPLLSLVNDYLPKELRDRMDELKFIKETSLLQSWG